jgi:peroxiredoxin family protein
VPGLLGAMNAHEPLSILLISGAHDRAHYAFVIAAGAASLGRRVQLFATNAGCHALLQDWSGLEDAKRDAAVMARGVGGLAELRDACVELGVSLIVCEAGLRAEAIDPRGLMAGVDVAGVARFLADAAGGQIVSL